MGSNTTGTAVSTTSSGGNSEEDLQQKMDERKKKRMQSNRESACRSRIRKQKHWDDLVVQATVLKHENHQILSRIHITTQHYLSTEGENTTLRAQMMELKSRLQNIVEMLEYIHELSGMVWM